MKNFLVVIFILAALCSYSQGDVKPTGPGFRFVQTPFFFFNTPDSSFWANLGPERGWIKLDKARDPWYIKMLQGADTVVTAIHKKDTLNLPVYKLKGDSLGISGYVTRRFLDSLSYVPFSYLHGNELHIGSTGQLEGETNPILQLSNPGIHLGFFNNGTNSGLSISANPYGVDLNGGDASPSALRGGQISILAGGSSQDEATSTGDVVIKGGNSYNSGNGGSVIIQGGEVDTDYPERIPGNIFLKNGNAIIEKRIISTFSSETESPFEIADTIRNVNLNADLLDGKHASYFKASADTINSSGYFRNWQIGEYRKLNNHDSLSKLDERKYQSLTDTLTWGLGLSQSGHVTKLDTADASVLSRQRAANTYQTKLTNAVTGIGVNGYLAHFTGASLIDSSGVYWDQSTKRLGLNTNAPLFPLHISSEQFAPVMIDSYSTGNASGIIFRSTGGNKASPTQLLADRLMGGIMGRGYSTNGTPKFGANNVGAIQIWSGENFTSSAQGTYITMGTTPLGDTTRVERVRILPNGNVGIRTSTPLLTFDTRGLTGLPSTSGTTPVGIARFGGASGSNSVLDFGITQTPSAAWIQSVNAENLSFNNNLLLNPNGGRIIVGNDSIYSSSGSSSSVSTYSNSTGSFYTGYGAGQFSNSTDGVTNYLLKSRGTVVGSHVKVQNGDVICANLYEGSDGVAFKRGARFDVLVDGTTSTNIVPMYFRWQTMNAAGTLAERMRLSSVGYLGLAGLTTPSHWLDVSSQTDNRSVYAINAVNSAHGVQSDVSSVGSDEVLTNRYYAWSFVASNNHSVGNTVIQLKSTGTITNTTDYITIKVYSDNAGAPGTLLFTSDNVRYGALTSAYTTYYFGGDYSLISGTTYWIVVDRSSPVTGGGSISINRNATALTTTNVATPASGDWTVNTGKAYMYLYGQTAIGIYGNSSNKQGVYGVSMSSYGVYGSSQTGYGIYGASTNNFGVVGTSSNSYGIYGSSVNNVGTYGSSTNSVGIYGSSTNNYGLQAQSINGYGGIIQQSGTLSQANNSNVLLVRRVCVTNSTGSLNATGNVFQIIDSPSGTGTVSGSLINGVIDGSPKLDFNPRVVDGASAIAYMFDTKNALANATSRVFEIRNGGTASVTLLGNGKLGLGTSTPTSALEVINYPASIPSLGSGGGGIEVGGGSYGMLIGTISSGKGYIQQQRTDGTATSYDLTLQPNGGNVEIPLLKYIKTGYGAYKAMISDASGNISYSRALGSLAYKDSTTYYAKGDTTGNKGLVTIYGLPAKSRASISLTTTGNSGAATYNSTTGVLNIPQYSSGSMTYPGAGLPTSTGSAWGTSLSFSAGTTLRVLHENGVWDYLSLGALSNVFLGPTVSNGDVLTYDSSVGWRNLPPTGAMTYPSGSGIPIVSGGSSWGTTITDNSSNWNTAYGWGNWASNFGTTSGKIAEGNHSHSTYVPYTGATGDLNMGSYAITATSFCQSDSTLKRNIRRLESHDFSFAAKIDFQKFSFKSDSTDHTHFGVIAQDVEKLVPEVVRINPESGKKEVNYTEMLLLIVAQQKEAIEKLEKRVAELENTTKKKNVWKSQQCIIAQP